MPRKKLILRLYSHMLYVQHRWTRGLLHKKKEIK